MQANSESVSVPPSSLPPQSSPVFRARGLTKVYRMGDVEVHALRGVDLDLFPGEFVVLLGPSGSGKSTLLNILGGLDAPTGGEVWYVDHCLTGADDRALTRFRREHVGFVFQFYNLIPSLTARENVAIARAIAKRPAVLLCDEPTGALDSSTGIRVLETLEQVNATLGTTTVVITHNAGIGAMAHRVLYLGDGRIVREVRPPRRTPAKELSW